jgi:signal transduction histidine kinase/DNA-binding response OmpR family regulator/ligand-binding sensor domain-containing protein
MQDTTSKIEKSAHNIFLKNHTGILFKLVLGIFFCFSASIIYAQITDYKFNHIDFNDGLSNLSISCFVKDKLGFIWIGTEDGLNRFDGKNLKVYRHNEDNNSISNNKIYTLLAAGNYLYIGNEGYGIDRYNLETDEFENFGINHTDESVPFNVNHIYELQNKNLLLGAANGLYFFDTKNEKLSPYFDGEAKNFFAETVVKSILEDEDGKIWLGTNKDVFCVYPDSKKFFHFQSLLDLEKNDNHWVQYITKGPDNRYYVLKQNWLIIIDEDFKKVILKKEFNQYMSNCMFDANGKLWIIGDGLFFFDGQEFQQVKHDPLNPNSISDKLTKSIYIDNEDIIWIGTWNSGVSYFNPKNEMHHIKNLIKRSDGKGLPENPVDFLFEDHKKRIWIGTNWGGITIYDIQTGKMEYLSTSGSSNPKISADLNYSALLKNDKIWIGTFRKGLDCFDIHTKKFTNYPITEINGQMPKINNVVADLADTENLLLCTEKGLIRFNTKTADSYHFSPDEYNLPREQFLDLCHLDKNRMIIVVDKTGLFMYNKTNNSFHPFLRDELAPNVPATVKVDHDNNLLLIGANNGLNIFDFYSNNLFTFNSRDGLYNHNITGILKENRGFYWLSTTDGLCLVDIKKRSNGEIYLDKIRNLSSLDGLVGNQFRERACIQTSDGKVLFGSNSGLSIFDPEIFSFETTPQKIILSDLKIFNQSVKVNPGEEDAILSKSIFYTDNVELSHKNNSVSFDFTALEFFNNQNIKYKYKLEGFDRDWITTGTGTATYTNLNTGEYIFKVGIDNDFYSHDSAVNALAIIISPPFYKTKGFIFSFAAFLIAVVFTFYFLRLQYYKKRQLYLENVVAERTNELKSANESLLEKNKEISLMAKRVHEADEMKLRFFANIHHEFRTALSLIIGPVEQLKNNKSIVAKIGDDIKIISSNAKRLYGFVNEILEYRKIDNGKPGLNLIKGDAIDFLKEIKSLYDCKARELEVDYTFQTDRRSVNMYFDNQKFEHIVFNLLSNAFKFTQRKGAIKVVVSTVECCERIPLQQSRTKLKFNPEHIPVKTTKYLEVALADNGIGFKDEEQIKLIWERFYRLPNRNLPSNVGSGIGLALTKELTQIHQGLIYAESNETGGATFKVWFPLGNEWFRTVDNVNFVEGESPLTTRIADVEDNNLPGKTKIPVNGLINNSLPTVLVIEDNTDIHLFLNNHLLEYKLRFTDNGKEGIETAKELVPDLIVCDIMLPDIQGYHIVKELKNHIATSHIPIIMLTALVGEDNMIKALNIGADDYITKPFTINTLKARINNLLNLRDKLREIYSLKPDMKPEEISSNPVDQFFYKKLNDVILENVENDDFSVVTLAELMGMNRVQLYRKVNSITQKGPSDMIRNAKLNYSKSLLKNRHFSVADVAVKVGYSESSSFIRAFTQEFGISPLNYAKKVVSYSKRKTV